MEQIQGETKVFGAENLETQPTMPQESQQETGNTKFFGFEEETEQPKPETEVKQADEKAEEHEEVKTEVKEETKTEEKTENKPLKISFNKKPEQTERKEESTGETPSITAEQVLNFLKGQNPNLKDISDLAELSQRENLPESVAKFKKFVEETGRENVSDFYNVSKDWNKVNSEDRIREYLKLTEPNISDESLETQLELISISEDELEYLTDREQKQRKIDFEKFDRKALDFLQKKAQEYATPVKETKQPTQEDIAEAYAPYWESRDESLKKLNDVSFEVDGIGNIKIPISQDLKKLIADNTQTQEAFFKRWQNDEGVIDTNKSNLDTMWGIPEIRDQHLIPEMLEQFKVLLLDAESKQRRNVQLDPAKQINQTGDTVTFQKLSNKPQEDKKYGTPLIKR